MTSLLFQPIYIISFRKIAVILDAHFVHTRKKKKLMHLFTCRSVLNVQFEKILNEINSPEYTEQRTLDAHYH